MQMLDEAVRAAGSAEEGEEPPEPVRLDVNVDAYVPADYVPYEQAKIEVHRRVAAAVEVADVERLREDLEDRFGPIPEPLENLLSLAARAHQVRPGGRADRQLPRRSPRGRADRARFGAGAAAARGAARGAVRVGPLAGLDAGSARWPRSASRAS